MFLIQLCQDISLFDIGSLTRISVHFDMSNNKDALGVNRLIKPEVFLEANFDGHDEFFYWKGTRFDVYVKIDELYYNMEFDCMGTVQSAVKSFHEKGWFYTTVNNQILVEDVSIRTIIKTVERLYEHGYFLDSKPVNVASKKLFLAVPSDFSHDYKKNQKSQL